MPQDPEIGTLMSRLIEQHRQRNQLTDSPYEQGGWRRHPLTRRPYKPARPSPDPFYKQTAGPLTDGRRSAHQDSVRSRLRNYR
jgi:hypothetical protein